MAVCKCVSVKRVSETALLQLASGQQIVSCGSAAESWACGTGGGTAAGSRRRSAATTRRRPSAPAPRRWRYITQTDRGATLQCGRNKYRKTPADNRNKSALQQHQVTLDILYFYTPAVICAICQSWDDGP